MMKMTIRVIASALLLLSLACERPRPTTPDTTPPEITVYVVGVRGRNFFRSIDGPQKTPNDCVKVPDGPQQLIMIAGDAGGLETVTLSAAPSVRITPESVDVTPRPPEGSYSIRPEGLIITLTPPSPTTIRTGATASLEVNGTLPYGVSAWARDRAGNTAVLPSFYLTAERSPVVCRNN